MAIPAGAYSFRPGDGTLAVRTGRSGAAAKAGHDLLLHVTGWQAVLEVGDGIAITLDADSTSLRVQEGTGGMKALDDDDRSNIEQTIDDEVLHKAPIEFRSTAVTVNGDRLTVQGELTLAGNTRPIALDVEVAGGRLSARTVLTQTDWGIKPYSALFGALKVADEVSIELEAELPQSR